MKKRIFGLVLAIVLCLEISVPAAAAGPTFRDVPADFWAYAQIERAFADGAINGTSHDVQTGERRFSPGGTVTMAQFVTILCRKFFPEQLKASTATGPWYAQAQDVALKNYLYTYTSAGTKGMGKAINRTDMAGVLYATLAAIGCKPTDAETQGVDAQIADYNRIENPTPVVGVVALGIIDGVDEQGTFAGERYMSRAQAAAVYCRLVDATAEKQSALRQGASLRFDAPFDAPHTMQVGERDRIIDQHYLHGERAGDGWDDSVFTSSNPAVVRVVRSDEIEAVGPGTAVITCTSHLYNVLTSASCTITVGGASQTTPPGQTEKPTENGKPTESGKPTTPATSAETQDLSALRAEMLEIINAEREKVGVSPLVLDEKLCAAAQVRAEEIVRNYSHTRPDGSRCFTALDEQGLSYSSAGENIYQSPKTVEAAMEGWMNSAGHRANILNQQFQAVGIGFYYTDSGWKYHWAQMFTDRVSSQSGGQTSGSGQNQRPGQSISESLTSAAAPAQLAAAINDLRADAGLSPLTLDTRACAAAQVRAGEQISKTHLDRPDGRPFGTALSEAGVPYQSAEECIISGQGTADGIMETMSGYSKFRGGMLSETYSRMGIGFVRSDTQWPYCSIIFYS